MATTDIEWTRNPDGSKGRVWNPVTGCSKVSQGCKNCYAEVIAKRFWGARAFTDVRCHEDRLEQPLHWRKPARIFVNSMSDLFHEDVPFEFIDKVFAVMALCPQHTFQILTKRPERMRDYFHKHFTRHKVGVAATAVKLLPISEWRCNLDVCNLKFPLPNCWLGVSVEDQKTADQRIPLLLQTPAAVRWVSYEPALGPVNLVSVRNRLGPESFELFNALYAKDSMMGREQRRLDWVVVGGESGPGARPMHPDWARSVRDQCVAAGVPFFFKQWGEWEPQGQSSGKTGFGSQQHTWGDTGDSRISFKVGKKSAGRSLDGKEWSQYPTSALQP